MHQICSALRKVYDKFVFGCNMIAVGVIFLLAMWVTADVFGRYLFNHPIAGTTELVQTGLCAVVFLSVAYTMQKGRHIKTTVIVDQLSPSLNNYLGIANSLIEIAIFALLCFFSWKAAWVSWLVNEFDGEQIRIPVFPSRFAIVVGSALLVIQSLIEFSGQLGNVIGYHKGQK